MYEIRKWIIKPVANEVLYSNISFEALEKIIVELTDDKGISEKQFFDMYEIEEIETGLKNNEILCPI